MALGGFVYILGGETGNNTVSSSVEIYQNTLFTIDETDNGNDATQLVQRQTKPAPMIVARSEAEAVADTEGKAIYVMGGRTDNNNLTLTMEVYDVTLDCWKLLPDMRFGRKGFRSGCVEDRIIVVGGSIEGVATDIVEMFNITTQTWSHLRHLPSPATDFALAKVHKSNLNISILKEHFKFPGDVVVEQSKRVNKPVAEHFNWKL